MLKLRCRTARCRGPVVALVCVLAFAAAPAVAHAGTLDQSQTATDGSGFFFGTDSDVGVTFLAAQTFTAGLSGGLDQVDVLLRAVCTTGVDVTAQIRTVAAGSPTGTVLASATIAAASVPTGTPAFVSAAFSSPAPVTAGTSYAIVLSANGATCGPPGYAWSAASGDPYPRGAPFFSTDGGATWDSPGAADFAFKTYVATDSTPPTVSCSATPASLKSNNHKLAAITTSVTVTDEAGGSGAAGFTLVSVTSSQADSGLAADDVPNDIQGWTTGTADTSGLLRQERYGTDRVYTLTYRGSDKAGNTATCQTTVKVTKG